MVKDKLEKLIDVKSFVTIVLTLVFCSLSLMGRISGSEFMSIFTTVIAFYFGTQYEKKKSTQDTKEV